MFYERKARNLLRFADVKAVKAQTDLKVFLETFDQCYRKGDPQNPYGELGSYLKVAEKAWKKYKDTDRLLYFVAYKGKKPVAVASLTSHAGLGYISNVGSLKSVRGEGYGKLATLYCVYKSQQIGNKVHCLATEEGTYPNEFYKRIGFRTRFTGDLFVKK